MSLVTKRSLSWRFSTSIIGVVMVILLVFTSLLILDSIRKLETELSDKLELATTLAQQSLPMPLWSLDSKLVKEFVAALLLDGEFVYVGIASATDKPDTAQTRPDYAQYGWTYFEKSPQFLTKTVAIEYRGAKEGESEPAGVTVGVLHVAVTKERINKEIRTRGMYYGALMLFLFATISLTSITITKWYVARPLSGVVQAASLIAEGRIDEYLETKTESAVSQDEIGILTGVFRRMTAYLRGVAFVAAQVSSGNMRHDFVPKSEHDTLGRSIHQMTVYLNEIERVFIHISQGNLQDRLTVRSKDDLIGEAFVQMQSGFITLISRLRTELKLLSSVSNQTLETSSKNSEALRHIGEAAGVTSSDMQKVHSSAEEIRLNMEQLAAEMESAVGSIEQINVSVRQTAEHSGNLSRFATDTTESMTGIARSLEQINEQVERSRTLSEATTRDATHGQGSVERVIQSMGTIAGVTDNVSNIIGRLKKRSTEIGTILDVINEVAQRTSLLALNASIIASQAGVHGRGFMVVAKEIEELATRVATYTKEIDKIVVAVQRDTADAARTIVQGEDEVRNGVEVADQAGKALEEIRQSASKSSEVATGIAELVHLQTATHSKIARSTQDVSARIADITRAAQEQERNLARLLTMVGNLNATGSQILKSTQVQQQSTQQVTSSMKDVMRLVGENVGMVERLASLAHEMASQSDALKRQVARFVLPESSADRDDRPAGSLPV